MPANPVISPASPKSPASPLPPGKFTSTQIAWGQPPTTPSPPGKPWTRPKSTTTPSPPDFTNLFRKIQAHHDKCPPLPTATAPSPEAPFNAHPAAIAHNLPYGHFGFMGFTSIQVRDLDQAQAFYSAVFGWEFEPANPNHPSQRVFTVEGCPIAGVIHLELPDAEDDEATAINSNGSGKRKSNGNGNDRNTGKTTVTPVRTTKSGREIPPPVEDPVRPKMVDYITVEDVEETLGLAVNMGALVLRDKWTMGRCELAEIEFEGVVHGIMARPDPDPDSVRLARGLQLHNVYGMEVDE